MRFRSSKGDVFKALGILLCLFFVLFNYSPAMVALKSVPDVVYLDADTNAIRAIDSLPAPLHVNYNGSTQVLSSGDDKLNDSDSQTTLTIDLFGFLPIKNVVLHQKTRRLLVPCGESVGVALHTKGVLIVGTSDVVIGGNSERDVSTYTSPAATSGLKAGDVIVSANGIELNDTDHLVAVANEAGGNIALNIRRNGEILSFQMQAIHDPNDNTYKLGAWVRDSTAGIGTISFYDPISLSYAALGHAISDIDTNTVFEVSNGEIARCVIVDVVRGEIGKAGELLGTFGGSSPRLGDISENCEFGLFGKLYSSSKVSVVDRYSGALPVAYPNEVKIGDATVLTTVESNSSNGTNNVREYSCKVVKLFSQNTAASKGFVLEITDSRLTDITGGIVQGMSGSPIIQDGKIIGVITHVMINDPLRGYCMYAYWMGEKMG